MAQFLFSENYDNQLERIEDYILEAADSIDKVSEFLDQHDQVLRFIEQNPTTAAAHPTTGDQSWFLAMADTVFSLNVRIQKIV